MNIQVTQSEYAVSTARYISPNNAADYFFIDYDHGVTLDIDGEKHDLTLQTGHGYRHGDYGQPSNLLEVYDQGSSAVLFRIYRADVNELESQETIDEINEDSETSFSMEDMQAIKEAINDLIIDSQFKVGEAERGAEEAMAADDRAFVQKDYVEVEEFEDEDGRLHTHRQAWAESEILAFDTEEEADEYVEKEDNATRVTKEYAYANERKQAN